MVENGVFDAFTKTICQKITYIEAVGNGKLPKMSV